VEVSSFLGGETSCAVCFSRQAAHVAGRIIVRFPSIHVARAGGHSHFIFSPPFGEKKCRFGKSDTKAILYATLRRLAIFRKRGIVYSDYVGNNTRDGERGVCVFVTYI